MTNDPAEIERTILTTLNRLLGRDDLGVHENFFDLGADSMLLVQARQELSQVVGRDLTDVDLFTYPNVAALVGFLTGAAPAGAAASEAAGRAEMRRARLTARRSSR